MKKIIAFIITLGIIIILLNGVIEIPPYGRADNPSNNATTKYYLGKAEKDTGARNIVTSIVLDYRAYDTFVEASILFTSSIIVIILLKKDNKRDEVGTYGRQ